jgi:hypothetical protein
MLSGIKLGFVYTPCSFLLMRSVHSCIYSDAEKYISTPINGELNPQSLSIYNYHLSLTSYHNLELSILLINNYPLLFLFCW